MTAGCPPQGYRHWREGPHEVVAWEPAAAAVREALAGSRSLHQWAEARAERVVETGRGRLYAVRLGPLRAAVRHYRRGGWMALLLGDRYIGRNPRPFTELATSERLRSAGVRTPRVLTAVVTWTGDVPSYRADVATEWLEPGLDLFALLVPNLYPLPERRAAVGAAGETIGRAHRAGLDHPDLNPGNLFVQPLASGWTAALLDLDRARFPAGDEGGFKKKTSVASGGRSRSGGARVG